MGQLEGNFIILQPPIRNTGGLFGYDLKVRLPISITYGLLIS